METNQTGEVMQQQTAENIVKITALYEAAFHHLPDTAGLQWWLNDMEHGKSMQQIATLFMQNPEFVAAHPAGESIDHYLSTIHQNAFGRAIDTYTLNHWEILNFDAVPRVEALVAFAEMSIPLAGQTPHYPDWW